MTHRWGRGGALPQFNPAYYGSRMLQPMTVPEYLIALSLRFNSADGAYLNFTPGASNRDAWTLWFPIKRANLGITATLLSADSTSDDRIYFNSSDQLCIDIAGTTRLVSTEVFRDPAAWGMLRIVFDAANGTAANRLRVFKDAREITAWGTDTRSGISTGTAKIGHTVVHNIGRRLNGTTNYFDGYLTDVAFKASADVAWVGQIDATTGQFVPTAPAGALWWLNFSDNSGTTSATLGKDNSGNSNNWTPNSFSVTAGVGNDSLTDTPTNNFCVFNKLTPTTTATLTNGNLDAGASAVALGSFGLSSGLHYWEVTSTGGTTTCGMHNGSATSTTTVTTGNTKGFRFDANNGTFDWTSDGSSWTSIATGLTSGPYFPYVSTAAATTASLNAGQRTLAYTAPSGYSTLCTSNLSTPTIKTPSAYFDVETFTGTGATRSKTGLAFQPDLVWFKGRSGATDHALYDAVRGVQKQIESNTTTAESTETTGLTAFNSDGYTTGALAQLNTNAATYVAWLWKKGVTPGFDIVSYTGNATNRTISHALGVAPKFVIVKRLSGSNDWFIWHSALAGTEALVFTTSGKISDATLWNSTTPTSSVFSLGTHISTNGNGVGHIAYLWANVAGFSRFGSYTGNGSADGPFVHCGFRPKYVFIKRADTTAGYWRLHDTARDTYNVSQSVLYPNDSLAQSATSNENWDILSNGFKIRTADSDQNGNGVTYIFAAFAEFPFKYANAR